jgi:ribose 5-phosphate isomerase B
MKIYIGGDHAGFELKTHLVEALHEMGFEVVDKGAFEHSPEDDYPDFVNKVAEAVAGDTESKGIVIGKSGEGEAMCANRHKGIRAAVYYGGKKDLLVLSRAHNDANVLSLAAGFLGKDEADIAVKLWLETPFSDEERHVRRLAKF